VVMQSSWVPAWYMLPSWIASLGGGGTKNPVFVPVSFGTGGGQSFQTGIAGSMLVSITQQAFWHHSHRLLFVCVIV
jgi:hypothetical protein